MTCKINADTTNGLKLTSDTSGVIDLQSNGVTKVSFDVSGNMTTSGTIPSSALTGALPAIDGSALTGISGDVIASSLGTSDNTNGYIRFSNNLLINWVRKTSTLQQTITFPLAFTEVYGAYTGADTSTTAYINVRSLSTTQISLGSQGALILGWALVFGRKT